MHWCSRAPLRLGQATKCRWLARVPIFTNHLAGGNDECPLNLQTVVWWAEELWQIGNEWNTNAVTLACNDVCPAAHCGHVAHPEYPAFWRWSLVSQ